MTGRKFAGSAAILCLPALAALFSACSASDAGLGAGVKSGASSSSSGQGGAGGSIVATGSTGSGSGGTVVTTGGSSGGGTGGVDACATTSAVATLTSAPVDVIIVLDNSGSMAEEMEAAETNINTNFASILDGAGIDYRVILLSRHRQDDRDDNEAASTSICVSAPLSGLASCPAELPVFSDKFFQWSEKIESWDALNWIIDGWSEAPDNGDYGPLAPNGYSPWLREGAKKAFVLMTDDDESNDDDDTPLTVDEFMSQLSALSPTHFGTPEAPTYTFHSIIGVAEKANPTEAYGPEEPLVETECTSNGADIESYGPTYQDLSIRTGGLRFPLCQFPGYDAVFQAIAADVIVKADIACDFEIPAPPAGQELDLTKVAVSKKLVDGTSLPPYGQAATQADCQADAFYIDQAQNRIFLCPDTCAALEADPAGGVDVLFTCESTIIVK